MSASPFFYIEVFNHKTGNWEKFDLYRVNDKGEYEVCDLWNWNGTHDLFSILHIEHSTDMPEFDAVHHGLPANASPEMYSIVDAHTWSEGERTYAPEVKWFNLADAMLYYNEYPEVIDDEAMENYWVKNDIPYNEVPKKMMPNPIKGLIDRVISFLEIGYNFWGWGTALSDVRIICWCSW